MDFSLTDEQKMVQETVRRFVERELMPLENEVMQNELYHELQMKAKELGFWGINTPEEYGGANLGAVMSALIAMEMGRTLVPFTFGGNADNILYHGNEWQKKEYLIPTIEGTRHSCFALTEPGAGSDPSAIRATAVKDASWLIARWAGPRAPCIRWAAGRLLNSSSRMCACRKTTCWARSVWVSRSECSGSARVGG